MLLALLITAGLSQSYAADKPADDYVGNMIKMHGLEANMRREIIIRRSQNQAAKPSVVTREQLEKTKKTDDDILIKLQTVYRKKLERDFTKEEIAYLKQLYTSSVFVKLQKFNQSVFHSDEARALISAEIKK